MGYCYLFCSFQFEKSLSEKLACDLTIPEFLLSDISSQGMPPNSSSWNPKLVYFIIIWTNSIAIKWPSIE
jgi:hypothetical protein